MCGPIHVAEVGAEGVVFTVDAKGERASVQLKMLGRHNVPNALAAIAVGLRSGMGLDECAAAVGEMRAGDKRGEVLEWRGAILINDCYNSNPAALNAMVDALVAIPGATAYCCRGRNAGAWTGGGGAACCMWIANGRAWGGLCSGGARGGRGVGWCS